MTTPYRYRDSLTLNVRPGEWFVVAWDDGTDEEGTPFPDKSYEANQLQSHPAAPEWVRNWEGPYYVRTKLVADD